MKLVALLKASAAVYDVRFSGVKKMMNNQGDVTKLIFVASDKPVPAAVVAALGYGAGEIDWTIFVSAMLGQDFGLL